MTDKKDLIDGLQNLMKSDGIVRSKMGRVYEIYDTLVELRNSGVKASDIEILLNNPAGVFKFDLPPGSLTSYMHRIKLKKAAAMVRRLPAESIEAKPKKPKTNTPAAPVVMDEGTPKKPTAVTKPATVADVKKAFAEKTDFSKFNVD